MVASSESISKQRIISRTERKIIMDSDMVSCRNCGHFIPEVEYVMHIGQCEKNLTKCLLCSERIDQRYLQNHIDMVHEIMTCFGCGEKLEKTIYNDHINSLCLKRIVKCKSCEYSATSSEVEDHWRQFHSTSICYKCNQVIENRYMMEHHDTNCQKKLTDFSLQRDGMSSRISIETIPCEICTEEIEINELDKHQAKCQHEQEKLNNPQKLIGRGKIQEIGFMIPCEFCNKSVPANILHKHESDCFHKKQGRGAEFVSPCRFCHRNLSLKDLTRHENMCQTNGVNGYLVNL